jgi:hypothetical protein
LEKNVLSEPSPPCELITAINTIDDLSSFLGISSQKLRWLCNNINRHYKITFKPKKSGKLRKITNPDKSLRLIQEKINSILGKLPLPDYMQTGSKGKSILTNAIPHFRASVLVKIDIKDFYPSICFTRVFSFFKKLSRFSNEVAWCLARLTTLDDEIPQGALTSPTLVALIAYGGGNGVAAQLKKVAEKFHGQFTFYGDDGCLSGPLSAKDYMLISAQKTVERFGFTWHPEKTSQAIGDDRKVTPGVDVTHGPDVPKEKRAEYKKQLLDLEKKQARGECLDSNVIKSMQGKSAYMRQLNYGAGKNYRKRLKKLL